MPQMRIRQSDELEWISAEEYDARFSHLMKLDGKYVGGVREFLDGEVNRKWMT
jgi:hypothetical protein